MSLSGIFVDFWRLKWPNLLEKTAEYGRIVPGLMDSYLFPKTQTIFYTRILNMEKAITQNIEKWKKLLLDFSKRNRLYNFHTTKRTNLEIASPEFGDLYNRITLNNETLQFPYPVEDDEEEDDDGIVYSLSAADITVAQPKSLKEQHKSLSVLKQRAKSSFDEQGIHVLYLIFGLLC